MNARRPGRRRHRGGRRRRRLAAVVSSTAVSAAHRACRVGGVLGDGVGGAPAAEAVEDLVLVVGQQPLDPPGQCGDGRGDGRVAAVEEVLPGWPRRPGARRPRRRAAGRRAPGSGSAGSASTASAAATRSARLALRRANTASTAAASGAACRPVLGIGARCFPVVVGIARLVPPARTHTPAQRPQKRRCSAPTSPAARRVAGLTATDSTPADSTVTGSDSAGGRQTRRRPAPVLAPRSAHMRPAPPWARAYRLGR